jgi:hypothetical protein
MSSDSFKRRCIFTQFQGSAFCLQDSISSWKDCIFQDNDVYELLQVKGDSSKTLHIENSIFLSNTGNLLHLEGGNSILTNTIFSDNQMEVMIMQVRNCSVDVRMNTHLPFELQSAPASYQNCIFEYNDGGIVDVATSDFTPFTNCSFIGNTKGTKQWTVFCEYVFVSSSSL